MTLSDLSSIGSFISGIAVLASLIFVGFQLRQNTQAVRATASQAHAANWQQIVEPVIENGDMARIWRAGLDDIDDLTDDERVRFIAHLSGCFRFFEGARLQWRHGQLDNEHWEYVETNVKEFIRLSGVKYYWAVRGHWHSKEFRQWLETLPQEVALHGLYELYTETT